MFPQTFKRKPNMTIIASAQVSGQKRGLYSIAGSRHTESIIKFVLPAEITHVPPPETLRRRRAVADASNSQASAGIGQEMLPSNVCQYCLACFETDFELVYHTLVCTHAQQSGGVNLATGAGYPCLDGEHVYVEASEEVMRELSLHTTQKVQVEGGLEVMLVNLAPEKVEELLRAGSDGNIQPQLFHTGSSADAGNSQPRELSRAGASSDGGDFQPRDLFRDVSSADTGNFQPRELTRGGFSSDGGDFQPRELFRARSSRDEGTFQPLEPLRAEASRDSANFYTPGQLGAGSDGDFLAQALTQARAYQVEKFQKTGPAEMERLALNDKRPAPVATEDDDSDGIFRVIEARAMSDGTYQMTRGDECTMFSCLLCRVSYGSNTELTDHRNSPAHQFAVLKDRVGNGGPPAKRARLLHPVSEAGK